MNEYTYSKGMITRIAKAYSEIYGGIPESRPGNKVRDEVIEYILYKVITKEPVTYREIAERAETRSPRCPSGPAVRASSSTPLE